MSTYEKFTKDIGIITITNIIIALRGLILLPIIAKTLGTSGYGIWAQAIVTLSLLAPVSTFGLAFALTRFLAGEKNKKQIQEGFFSVLVIVLCLSSLIALALLLFASPIANTLFNDANTIGIVKITAILVPFSAANLVFLNFFRAFRQMKTYSILTVLQNFGEIAAIAFLVLSGFGIFGAIVSLLIVRIFIDAIMFIMITLQIGVKIPDFSNIKSYLKFGLPLTPSSIFTWIVNASDRYIIGIFMTIASVGVYSAAYAIASIVSFFANPLTVVLPPTLSKLYDENRMGEVKIHLTYSLKYFLMVAIPSVFGLSILSKQLLCILSTPEFVASGSVVIPIVASGALLFGVWRIIEQNLVLVKKTKLIGITWGIAGLVNLSLNIIFVPVVGIVGAAISTLITFVVATMIMAHMSFKQFTFPIDWMFILKSIFASIIMAFVISTANPVQVVDVLVWMGIGAAIYAGLIFLLGGIRMDEFKFFKELFK